MTLGDAYPNAPGGAVKPAVIVPTFDNAGTLGLVLDGLAAIGAGTASMPIVVVDDGSTDGAGRVVEAWLGANPGAALQIERHERNMGKARALKTGFDAAAGLGATHAVTIDSDAQHDPADITPLLALASRHPRALILGMRADHIEGCPPRCLIGRRAAGALVWLETFRRLADTQCGLRVYPLGLVRTVPARAERFGFETEIIVRGAWAGWEIVGAPVSCRYIVPGGRVSHWRPVVDTLRDARLHVRLFTRSLALLPSRLARAGARAARPGRGAPGRGARPGEPAADRAL